MNIRRPIEVCITIDTEFSIGGNFEDPALAPVAEPIVLGSVGGREQGLGFLLDSLGEFGIRATFFVETLQTAYFGDEPMGGIARRIAAAGHDVQLHLHPCWLHASRAACRTNSISRRAAIMHPLGSAGAPESAESPKEAARRPRLTARPSA
jgi:hypothetical protein